MHTHTCMRAHTHTYYIHNGFHESYSLVGTNTVKEAKTTRTHKKVRTEQQ